MVTMITRTALCILVACSLNVLAKPEFIINHQNQRANDKPSITFNDRLGKLTLDIVSEKGDSYEVIADLSNNLQEKSGEDCTQADAEICKRWSSENIQLTIGYEQDGWRQVTWVTHRRNVNSRNHTNCLPLGQHSWFGGPEQRQQYWPVQKFKFDNLPMVTHMINNQGVADPFWFNSRGVAVLVDRGVPLFIDQNTTRAKDSLCLIAKIAPPYRDRSDVVLSYKIGYHKNAKEAFMKSVNDFLGKPSGIPDERMIRHPIWSTWALYKAAINETTVRNFASEIKKHGFENSQLEIDDDWEDCYGSLQWNTKKFPDIQRLVRDLKRDGFRVTLWTHPFVNKRCPLYNQIKDRYLVKNSSGTETTWWNGQAGIYDFTNWEAAKDFEERQRKNLEYSGIDGLKFDAGETSWMPEMPNLNIPSSPYEDYPSHHTNEYLRRVAKFGGITEVRTAYRTQDLPIFLRMLDKDTKWGYDNGLKTLVTTLLQMNMVGYPLVLPDMIGGNVYEGDVLKRELFIRWLQANTFMPSLQYSRVPWEFDDATNKRTVEIALNYAELHANYTDTIIALMKNATKYGTPVNPPIWWMDPTDKDALEVDSEYMLGENILVAPILDEGVFSRDIYLPAGNWKDMGSYPGKIHKGKQWLRDYPAEIQTLPYFIRVNGAGSLSATLLVVVVSVFSATFGRRL